MRPNCCKPMSTWTRSKFSHGFRPIFGGRCSRIFTIHFLGLWPPLPYCGGGFHVLVVVNCGVHCLINKKIKRRQKKFVDVIRFAGRHGTSSLRGVRTGLRVAFSSPKLIAHESTDSDGRGIRRVGRKPSKAWVFRSSLFSINVMNWHADSQK